MCVKVLSHNSSKPTSPHSTALQGSSLCSIQSLASLLNSTLLTRFFRPTPIRHVARVSEVLRKVLTNACCHRSLKVNKNIQHMQSLSLAYLAWIISCTWLEKLPEDITWSLAPSKPPAKSCLGLAGNVSSACTLANEMSHHDAVFHRESNRVLCPNGHFVPWCPSKITMI